MNPFEVDSECKLFLPENDEKEPEVSIVIPAMNEALTIGEFVDWCKEGLRKANVRGEILIVSSSTDGTSEIALQKGARVLKTPQRGLGRAYIDSISHIRGEFCILGDADLTYDFREIGPFMDKFRQGYDYVMGSRFKGRIEKGAMPFLHRYLGTPVTTWILNLIFSSRFSDIHSGMRGITKKALLGIKLRSQSWEYASEMVIKAIQFRLQTTEVPIHFYKDRDGRTSHHKRGGWFSPWRAAWINLKAMFVYGSEFFLLRPGIFLGVVGLLLIIPLTFGPFTIGAITFSIFWMLFALTISIVGFQLLYMGLLANIFFDHDGAKRARIMKFFGYNRSVAISALLFVAGLVLSGSFILDYIKNGFVSQLIPKSAYLAIMGLELMILSFMNFSFTLLFHGATIVASDSSER